MISLIVRTLALAGVMVSLAGSPVSAAFFTVEAEADAPDARPGDGHCEAAGPPAVVRRCTLRAAIEEANALPGDDYITLPAGTYRLTFVGRGGGGDGRRQLTILDDLHLTGAGADRTIISPGGLDRVMNVFRREKDRHWPTVHIEGVTLEGGRVDPEVGQSGGGLSIGEANVHLRDCVILKNRATFGGGISAGGGGYLSLVRVTLSGNEAGWGGGILFGRGTLLATDTVVTENRADEGGGIHLEFGTLTVRGGAISGNHATLRGGGLFLLGSRDEGRATLNGVQVLGNSAENGAGIYEDLAVFSLIASEVSGNKATNNGGGIHFATRFDYSPEFPPRGFAQIESSSISRNIAGQDGGGLYNGIQLSINNSTLSGNEAVAHGGGLFNVGGNVDILYATIYSNAAALGGGFVNKEGGARGYGLVGGPVSYGNSIIALNKAGSCVRIRRRLERDFSPVTSFGYNLLDDEACSIAHGVDLFPSDPVLGPLAANGGPTLNHLPGFGSPAINAIPVDGWYLRPVRCQIGGTGKDQRFVDRPQGASCDIGAVEATPQIGEPPQQ